MIRRSIIAVALLAIAASGCAYTTRTLLDPSLKTIWVDNFANKIKITAEQSNLRMYRGYRPGMEIDLTKAVIDRFILDGNLSRANRDQADLILSGDLVDFRKEALRYDSNDNVEEYRIKMIVDMELVNAKTGKVLWTEKGFSGESTYRTGGSLAKTESAAVNEAIEDLARRIVERTVEGW